MAGKIKYSILSSNWRLLKIQRKYFDRRSVIRTATDDLRESSWILTSIHEFKSCWNPLKTYLKCFCVSGLLPTNELVFRERKKKFDIYSRLNWNFYKSEIGGGTHCSKSSFFVQKFNFDFPRKLSIFWGEKLVKMLWFWTF